MADQEPERAAPDRDRDERDQGGRDQDKREDERPRLSLRARLAFALVMLTLSLIAAEGLARLASQEVSLQRRVNDGGVFVPFEPRASCELLSREFRVRYDINAFGYRDKLDRREARSPGGRRIVSLGDSFASGWGVEFPEIYSSILEEETGVEVINAGRNAGCPTWYVYQARYVIERFRPDALIVQIFDNDLADNRQSRRKFKTAPGSPAGPIPERIEPRNGLYGSFSRFFMGLELRRRYRKLKREWGVPAEQRAREPYVEIGGFPEQRILSPREAVEKFPLRREFPGDFSFHDPAQRGAWAEDLRHQKELLEQLIAECRQAKVPLALIYIPCRQVFAPPRDLEDNPHRALIRELCAASEGEVPLIDATEALAVGADPATAFFPYDGHLNAAGHARLAAAIEKRLREAWPELFPRS